MNKIIYFSCERFFPTEEYEKFSAVKGRQEIVSYDCGLMGSIKSSENLDEVIRKVDKKHKQLIAIYKNPPLGFNKDIGNDFEFCGYDLCEEFSVISAITNCGERFESAIDNTILNEYGLIKDYENAIISQKKLEENFPDESHTNCETYAIWRKII